MVILITGVCGFIGQTIANVLKKKGNLIIGIDKISDSDLLFLDEYYQCDITQESDIISLIKKVNKCDVVVHAAAIISYNNLNSTTIQANCNGTLQIGKFSLLSGVKQIIYISSVPIIGKPEVLPITEDNNYDKPSTLYHHTKLMGEKILLLPEFESIIICILRLTAPISPEMPQNRMLSLFINKALNNFPITLHGKGNRLQNYIDTRDIGKAVKCSIKEAASGLFLISGQSITNIEVALLCNEICNSNAGLNFSGNEDPEEEYRWVISNEKSERVLKFKPDYNITKTLTEMKNFQKRAIK
jgi:nucleoside-diphosphate-sugar epimerase